MANALIMNLVTGTISLAVPLIVAWICKKWLGDLVKKNKNTAQNIATVMDRLTDEVVKAYPGVTYIDLLNQCVDEGIKVLDLVDVDVINREAKYQLAMRGINPTTANVTAVTSK